MTKHFPEYDTFVPVPPLVQFWLIDETAWKRAIGDSLSNPGGSVMSAGFFELKASEPAVYTYTSSASPVKQITSKITP